MMMRWREHWERRLLFLVWRLLERCVHWLRRWQLRVEQRIGGWGDESIFDAVATHPTDLHGVDTVPPHWAALVARSAPWLLRPAATARATGRAAAATASLATAAAASAAPAAAAARAHHAGAPLGDPDRRVLRAGQGNRSGAPDAAATAAEYVATASRPTEVAEGDAAAVRPAPVPASRGRISHEATAGPVTVGGAAETRSLPLGGDGGVVNRGRDELQRDAAERVSVQAGDAATGTIAEAGANAVMSAVARRADVTHDMQTDGREAGATHAEPVLQRYWAEPFTAAEPKRHPILGAEEVARRYDRTRPGESHGAAPLLDLERWPVLLDEVDVDVDRADAWPDLPHADDLRATEQLPGVGAQEMQWSA